MLFVLPADFSPAYVSAQMYIPLNTAAYTPNTLNNGSPMQANQTVGNGFFTAPERTASGALQRSLSSTFRDVWSQPRLFFNSLLPVEQQFVINAMRFETSMLTSEVVKRNVLIQLNRVSHEVASRVGAAIGMEAPPPDPTFYNDNVTSTVSIFGEPLLKLDGLRVGVLASVQDDNFLEEAAALAASLESENVNVVVVGEYLAPGVNVTYSGADASAFDSVVVAAGATNLFSSSSSSSSSSSNSSSSNSGGSGNNSTVVGARNTTTAAPTTSHAMASTLFPAGRPAQILTDAFRWGKPVGGVGSAASVAFDVSSVKPGDGVYEADSLEGLAEDLKEGLATYRFLDRFPVDSDS